MVPLRVQAAFRVLELLHDKNLTSKERGLYDSALETLRLYVTGEMEFQERPEPFFHPPHPRFLPPPF